MSFPKKREGCVVGKRILLANDPELLRTLKDSLFGRSGFVLMVAESEQQAFELIEEQDPALAIFNLEQSGLSGEVCCRRVKNDPILRGTPIILVLPPGVDQELERCKEAGCDGNLYKPIDPDELTNTVCRLLNIANRGAPRVEVRIPLRWGKDIHNLRPGWILNLNVSGAFISTAKLFPIDTMLNLEISLTGSDHPLCCKGRVAWVNHPEWVKTNNLPIGMGMQFLDLAPEDAEALRSFLDQLPHGKV
jgi:CheY-like chemotaxis protein